MWPFNKNAELQERRKRILRMMDKQDTKDKKLAEIQPFLDLITERALVIRHKYLEVGNEVGNFVVSEDEMDYIKKWSKIMFDKEREIVKYLGMNVVMGI